MIRYLGRRSVRLVLVFLLVTMATMLLLNLTPGDPAYLIAGETAPPEVVQSVREEYGLDEPVYERYADWIGNIAQGDFGRSYFTKQPVIDAIRQRLPVTLELALLAQFIVAITVIPLGLYTAYRSGGWLDRTMTVVSSAFVSVPPFVLALLLVTVFGLSLGWLPVSGWVPLTQDPWENLQHAILPATVLAVAEIVVLQPVLRADAMTTLQQEYITLARVKGVSHRRILFRHTLRASSISLVTLMGLSLARLFGGTLIVESIYALPGIGTLLINSINSKDFIMLQGVVTFIALVYLVVNFIVDILYSKLDPRLSVQ
ncbi:MAG: ABC transporter permease [Acidimicrobiia bacterium]